MHIKCRYFSRKNLATGGWNHPQMPLTVNWEKLGKVYFSDYRNRKYSGSWLLCVLCTYMLQLYKNKNDTFTINYLQLFDDVHG